MKEINKMSISDRQHLQLNREVTDVIDNAKTRLNDSFVGAYYIGDSAMSICYLVIVYDRSYVGDFDMNKIVATGTGIDVKVESVPYDFFTDEKRFLYSYEYPYEDCLYYGKVLYDTDDKLAQLKKNIELVNGSSTVSPRLGTAEITPPVQYIKK